MATYLSAPSPVRAKARSVAQVWAWVTLTFFVVVVLEGAVVRATSSGAGCGDHWPLCNGEVLPHFGRVATVIEFLHRSLTGLSSTMFFVLVGLTFYATPRRDLARKAALWSLGLLLLEAILGAVLVKGHYVENNTSNARVLVQSVHFTNTMLLLAAATTLAVLLGRMRWAPTSTAVRRAVLIAMAAVLIAGAAGSVAALADTIFPSVSLRDAMRADFAADSPLLIRMRWLHPLASLSVLFATLWLAEVLRREAIQRAARLLLANVLLQMVIGIADVLMLAPTWIQVLHLLGADLFWITLVVIATPVLLRPGTADDNR